MALTHVTEDDVFALPPTIAGRRRRLRNRITAFGAVIVLAVGVGSIWDSLDDPSCAPGVANIGGECIGVTAGDFPFNPGDSRFSAAEDRIRELNQQVVASGKPYVTVALLTSLTWTDTTALSRSKITHQLEGAAVALDRVNNEGVTGDAPLIQLLLANEGIGEAHYGTVIRQLAGMRGGDHPLDAVIGMGVSSGATLNGATELSEAGILMVASNITGDNLDSARIPGFSRVSPPNRDDVAAIAAYLETQPDLHRTMLVHAAATPQSNTGDKADFYTSTLAEDFQEQLGRYATVPSEPFNPDDNTFRVIATNLCTSVNSPNVVLYGGRQPYLPRFIQDLAQRPCNSVPITLVVGTDSCALVSNSDDPQQTSRIRTNLVTGKITVLCPDWVAPQNWADGTDAPPGFAGFVTKYSRSFTKNGDFGTQLDDGYAIMTHDALLTAANAIRLATEPPIAIPTPAQVLGNQFHMDAANTVPGASGTLTFVEANNGNPAGKPIYVLRIQPSGARVLLYTYPGR